MNSAALAAALWLAAVLPAMAEGVTITSNLTIAESDTTYDGADLVIDGPVTVAIDGPHAFNSILLTNRAVLTHSACTAALTHKLDLVVTEAVVVSADSRVDVTGLGYLKGRTVGNVTGGGAMGTAGGSYGGLGGPGGVYGGQPGAAYGDAREPAHWGSGGGASVSYGVGAGGGQVRIEAGELALEGAVLANGQSMQYAAGSGGAILVRAGTLRGGGEMRADGGGEHGRCWGKRGEWWRRPGGGVRG